MCLYVNRIKTEQELKTSQTSSHIFYKVFVKTSDHLLSPYWAFPIHKPGKVMVPDPISLGELEMINGNAFHARTREEALQQDSFYCEFFDRGEPVNVVIHANHKDIIAFGVKDDVALKAFTISFTDWYSIFPRLVQSE
jgi:hypothetical protein